VTRVRILWVSAETPSRDGQGGQRRQFHQINSLVARGHDVTVLVPTAGQSDASIRTIVPVIRPRLGLFGRMSRHLVRRMRRTIGSAEWDAIVVSHHESFWLLPDHVSAPVLLDIHNVMSHWHHAAGRAALAEQARGMEVHAIRAADGVMTCSAVETRRLIAAHPEASGKAFTAPLGVDPAEWPDAGFPRDQAFVALFGSWSWHPNRLGLEWYVRGVWPHVVDRVPEAVTLVAGSGVDDTSWWPSGIRFVGRVPYLYDFTSAASVVAVPVKDGVGASVKFAEALATGAAVVATADGASAFEAPPAFVSDDEREWAEWIVERLRRRSIEPAPSPARAIALTQMTWDAAAGPIDDWLRSHARRRATVGPISS
jgi:glycosyltransferase involved in cell wall biosynthesis